MIHTFWCDTTLNVVRTEGTLANWLECDLAALEQQEWRRFFSADSRAVIQQTLTDLSAGRAGSYQGRAVATTGIRLYIATRTMLIFEHGTTRAVGQTELEAWESPRTRCFLATRES